MEEQGNAQGVEIARQSRSGFSVRVHVRQMLEHNVVYLAIKVQESSKDANCWTLALHFYLPYSFLLSYAWWKENMWAMLPDQERKYNSEAR